MFLDFEGDRLGVAGGREFLFGLAWFDATGTLIYRGRWAHSDAEERAAFEELIDTIIQRLAQCGPTHDVYHYAPYEPAAIGRMMGRYADPRRRGRRPAARPAAGRPVRDHAPGRARERGAVLAQGPRAAVRLCAHGRPAHGAGACVRAVQLAIGTGAGDHIDPPTRAAVEAYNRDGLCGHGGAAHLARSRARGSHRRGLRRTAPRAGDGRGERGPDGSAATGGPGDAGATRRSSRRLRRAGRRSSRLGGSWRSWSTTTAARTRWPGGTSFACAAWSLTMRSTRRGAIAGLELVERGGAAETRLSHGPLSLSDPGTRRSLGRRAEDAGRAEARRGGGDRSRGQDDRHQEDQEDRGGPPAGAVTPTSSSAPSRCATRCWRWPSTSPRSAPAGASCPSATSRPRSRCCTHALRWWCWARRRR
jgi:hypothetical protein